MQTNAPRSTIEVATGELFGSLWHRLTDAQFRESVELFNRRFLANGFDLSWFKGKRCLDAGTGSGRYALAMAMHGAKVSACDVSETGLATAKERTAPIAAIEFRRASVLELPYADNSFDFACCAGVLHHTPSIERGLDELNRVLKPGGKLFLLLYGTGGLRWKMIHALRPFAQELGYPEVDEAIERAGLPANNRKNFLDDLFVPILTNTAWPDLQAMLSVRGYSSVERWTKARLDHEATPQEQVAEMRKLERIFEGVNQPLGALGFRVAREFVSFALENVTQPELLIGEGNHRLLATRL